MLKMFVRQEGRLIWAALLLWGLSGCAQIKPDMVTPRVSVADFQLVELGLFSGTAELGLVVDNPNPMGFKADGFSYRVLLGGTEIADTRSDQKLDIAASGETLVRVPIKFSYTGLLMGLQTMVDRQELSYEVSGKVFTRWMDFPFSKTDVLSLTQTQ
jgi:LEA14-like dessication related protein